eukprot:TRINITY_DN2560_c0_g1_i2.p1 TRINITY_DN2560_c0_g1~~TRINITY_DN2560_c0_g1_i2.p1  ORF type:complete len:291 (-),score=82.93 TRINITY_DN2560_c0_g1_i2:429-1208(-)
MSKSWADVEDEVAKQLDTTEVKDEKKEKEAEEQKIVRVGGLSGGGKIIIEQDDPNSPLYSVKSFEEMGLKPELLKGVYEMKYNKPSKIQEAALPVILEPSAKNLIGQAQSGTGKTAAFTLCVLSRSNPSIKSPQAMIVSPTRELARQILDVVNAMGKYSGLEAQLVVKDEKFPRSIQAQIIVGTPGKILDLLQKRTINAKELKCLVFDEADVMMDMAGMQSNRSKSKINCRRIARFCCFLRLSSRMFARSLSEPSLSRA